MALARADPNGLTASQINTNSRTQPNTHMALDKLELLGPVRASAGRPKRYVPGSVFDEHTASPGERCSRVLRPDQAPPSSADSAPARWVLERRSDALSHDGSVWKEGTTFVSRRQVERVAVRATDWRVCRSATRRTSPRSSRSAAG